MDLFSVQSLLPEIVARQVHLLFGADIYASEV